MKTKLLALSALMALSFSAAANDYFNSFDTNKDGSIDVNEHKQMTKGWMDKAGLKGEKRAQMNQNGFNKKDTNKDGKISLEEFKEAKAQQKKAKNKNKNKQKNKNK